MFNVQKKTYLKLVRIKMVKQLIQMKGSVLVEDGMSVAYLVYMLCHVFFSWERMSLSLWMSVTIRKHLCKLILICCCLSQERINGQS